MKKSIDFKLPRKLKKEIKKGFRKIIKPVLLSQMQMIESGFMVSTRITYSGSNTKSFRRLCKYAIREEKKQFERHTKQAINNIFSAENIKSDISKEDIIKFQQAMFIGSPAVYSNIRE